MRNISTRESLVNRSDTKTGVHQRRSLPDCFSWSQYEQYKSIKGSIPTSKMYKNKTDDNETSQNDQHDNSDANKFISGRLEIAVRSDQSKHCLVISNKNIYSGNISSSKDGSNSMLQKHTQNKQSAIGCLKLKNPTTQSECPTNEKNIMIEPALKAIENSPFLPTLLNYFKSIDHNVSNIATAEKKSVEENLEKKFNDANLMEDTSKNIQVNRKPHSFAENTDLTPGMYKNMKIRNVYTIFASLPKKISRCF